MVYFCLYTCFLSIYLIIVCKFNCLDFISFQIQDQLEDLLISHGDVIALQHDGGSSSLLQCQSSPQSLWQQPVLALNMSEWFWVNSTRQSADFPADLIPEPELDTETRVESLEGNWLEQEFCPIRVLYVGHNKTQLQGSHLSAGLPQPGLYSLLVSHQFSCHFPACIWQPLHAGAEECRAYSLELFLFYFIRYKITFQIFQNI